MSFVSNVLPTSLNGFSARALTHSINGGAVVPPYTARSHVTAPLYPRKPASTFLSPPLSESACAHQLVHQLCLSAVFRTNCMRFCGVAWTAQADDLWLPSKACHVILQTCSTHTSTLWYTYTYIQIRDDRVLPIHV